MKLIWLTVLIASAASAQSNFYAGGAYWDSEGKPHDGAMFVYGHQLSGTSSSFTTIKITQITAASIPNTQAPTVVSTGILTQLAGFGQLINNDPRFSINTVADAGGKMTNAGGISAAFSGGCVFIVRTNLRLFQYIALDVRMTQKNGVAAALLLGNKTK